MTEELVLGLAALVVTSGGGVIGWVVRGRRRRLEEEEGALGLYANSLQVIEQLQQVIDEVTPNGGRSFRDEVMRRFDGVDAKLVRDYEWQRAHETLHAREHRGGSEEGVPI